MRKTPYMGDCTHWATIARWKNIGGAFFAGSTVRWGHTQSWRTLMNSMSVPLGPNHLHHPPPQRASLRLWLLASTTTKNIMTCLFQLPTQWLRLRKILKCLQKPPIWTRPIERLLGRLTSNARRLHECQQCVLLRYRAQLKDLLERKCEVVKLINFI